MNRVPHLEPLGSGERFVFVLSPGLALGLVTMAEMHRTLLDLQRLKG